MHLPHIFAIATAAFASFAVAAPAEPGEQCLLICWAEEHDCEAPSVYIHVHHLYTLVVLYTNSLRIVPEESEWRKYIPIHPILRSRESPFVYR